MTSSSTELKQQLQLIEIKPGKKFSLATLRAMLPDVETLLFFAKVYALDAQQLGYLLSQVLHENDVVKALTAGDHSTVLQSYLVGGYEHEDHCSTWVDEDEECDCNPGYHPGVVPPENHGDVKFEDDYEAQGEILPEIWEQLEVTIAESILAVVEKLDGVLSMLPGKEGTMLFKTMAKMNAKRPTIGSYQAHIQHPHLPPNLVIFDVSGSVSRPTAQAIVDDVVSLGYKADAHFAIVSNTTTHWGPGEYSSEGVMRAAEFGGTHYETLAPLLDREWGTVITVADYDSSRSAQEYLVRHAKGRIAQVLDISLVGRPTFLAESIGHLADEVRPILIANGYVL